MSERFIFPGEYSMRIQQGQGNLLAFFDFVDLDTDLMYRDFRLINGQTGLFSSSPASKYEVEDSPKPKYSRYVESRWDNENKQFSAKAQQWFADLTTAAKKKYDEKLAERQRGGGAGAVANAPTAPQEKDDGLPF